MSQIDDVIKSIKRCPYSAVNLAKDIKTHAKQLEDVEAWEKRDTAIRKLAGMALVHEVEDREFCDALHKNAARILSEQITDLRSQIVRVACAAMVIFSQELGAWFNLTFEQYMLPALIKQLPVKAQPIRDSAHDCIQIILAHRTNVKLLRFLFNASTDKEKIIRGRVAEYLDYICANWERDAIQKNLGPLFSNLKPMLQDGSDVVRNYARRSVVALARDFPRAVAELLIGVDPKVMKMMETDLPEEVMDELTRMKVRTTSTGLQAPPVDNGNVRRSTGSFGAPAAKTRLSGGAARLGSPSPNTLSASVSIPRTQSQSDADSARYAPRSNGSPSSSRPSARPSVSNRTPVKTMSASPTSKADFKAQAQALASLGDLEGQETPRGVAADADRSAESRMSAFTTASSAPIRAQSDPADLLMRLQQLRTEVLKISAARE